MRDPRERLLDILDAIGHIERYTKRGRDVFEQDELIQSWVVRHLQVLGEAARAIPERCPPSCAGHSLGENDRYAPHPRA